MRGYWGDVHERAVKEAMHALSIDEGARGVIAIIVAVAVIGITWLAGNATEAGHEFLIKIAVTATIMLLFPGVYMWKFFTIPPKNHDQLINENHALSGQLKPNFCLSFHPEAEGLHHAVVEVTNLATGIVERRFDATYVRVRLKSVSQTTAASCKLYITRLMKESADGISLSEIALPHSLYLKNEQPFDILPNITYTADFLCCASEDNLLKVPECNWPNALKTLLNETGTYHFTITANAGGISASITVAVGWPGQWDKMVARQVLQC